MSLPNNLITLLNFTFHNNSATRNRNQLCLKFSRTNVRKFSISVIGAKYYNELDSTIKSCSPVSRFILQLKHEISSAG